MRCSINDVKKNEIISNATKLYKAGANMEMLLLFMRENGFFQIDSIIALRKISEVSLQEAKQIVDESTTWSDQYALNAGFRETAWQSLVELSRENNVNLPKIFIEPDPESSDS